jgi:serine/threonine protein kinase
MTTAWALPVDPFAAEGTERLGPYDVVGSIAEGGMGIVLRGRDPLTGALVALKTVRSPRRSDASSIRREIAALARLSHPGIVRLLADGTWNDKPWMALELLEGRTVCDEIDLLWRKGPEGLFHAQHGRCRSEDLPTMPAHIRTAGRARPRAAARTSSVAAAGRLHDVIEIATSLCRPLDHVHGLGLVHRDVKPANVFLGGDGRVTLLDFGLVCPTSSVPGGREAADSCVGTMEYAAPEQIRGEAVDGRADLYSLGCVLYELVTGRRPIETDASGELCERRFTGDPVAPSALASGVPRALEDLLSALLATNPDHRPANAAVVAEILTSIATSALLDRAA